VKGKASDIRSLSQEPTTKKDVKQLKFTAIALISEHIRTVMLGKDYSPLI
jgi:hypothetical protein